MFRRAEHLQSLTYTQPKMGSDLAETSTASHSCPETPSDYDSPLSNFSIRQGHLLIVCTMEAVVAHMHNSIFHIIWALPLIVASKRQSTQDILPV